ncbi:hypothetical protein [Salegentibacter salegens]|nr:hypothetical protein [Salegentibacter salegens]
MIEDCTRYLEQNCYTKHRVEWYKSMWRNGICRYMKDRGIKNYNCSIGEEFINDTISSKVTPAERDVNPQHKCPYRNTGNRQAFQKDGPRGRPNDIVMQIGAVK